VYLDIEVISLLIYVFIEVISVLISDICKPFFSVLLRDWMTLTLLFEIQPFLPWGSFVSTYR
jgi:hypothetical protein